MQNKVAKTNNFFKKSKEKDVSELEIVFKPIFVLLLICGFDHSFYKRNRLADVVITIYYLTIITCVPVLIFYIKEDAKNYSSAVEFVFQVITIRLTRDIVSGFVEKLTDIDAILKIEINDYIGLKKTFVIVILIIWSARGVITLCSSFYYERDNETWLIVILSLCHLLCLDIVRAWHMMNLYQIKLRLNVLYEKLEASSNGLNIIGFKDRFVIESKTRICLILYKKIANALEVLHPQLHTSMIIGIVLTVPKLMYNTYHILEYIENSGRRWQPLRVVLSSVHLLQIVLFVFMPCAMAESICVEVEKIRLALCRQAMFEADQSSKEDLVDFIRYTEVRNFKYRMWRMLPFDVTLPMDLINLCTSYIIVMINYSHLYNEP